MLEHYLSVITKGTCNNEENGKFSVIDFDSRQAFANSQVKCELHYAKKFSLIFL